MKAAVEPIAVGRLLEIVVPVVILIRLPAWVGESWPTLVRDDVGVTAGLVSALGLATMAARAVFAYQRTTPSWPRRELRSASRG